MSCSCQNSLEGTSDNLVGYQKSPRFFLWIKLAYADGFKYFIYMTCQRSAEAAALLRKSQRYLASHKAERAVALLRQAVDLCSVDNRFQLERSMYWLAIALIRLGRNPLAIKSFANARHLVPHGKSAAMYKRLTNDYGMPKSSCCDQDDYQAFFSIQVRRYLVTVPGGKFATRPEMDTVLQMIAGTWLEFKRLHDIAAIECGKKVKLYEGIRIQFPQLRLSTYSKCRIFALKAYKASPEFAMHKRVCMPWETDTV